MDIASLEAEAAELILPRFNEADALHLGQIIMDLARGLPIVINIRSANRTYFHAALPGSEATNDNWARRKSNTALMLGKASFLIGLRNAEKQRSLAADALSDADYADHGGAVPVRVTGVGMVAVATVSGLPQAEDHALVVKGLQALRAAIA